jgi:carbonic anhydrase
MLASVTSTAMALAAMLLIAPLPSAASCLHGTRLERRQIKMPDYGYSGERGPLNWHGISPAYKTCATGRNQAPINIVPGSQGIKTLATADQRPRPSYPSVRSAEVKNLGTTIQVHVGGTLEFEGSKYELRQFHFHTPSENRLLEEHYGVEAHLVHERVGPIPPGGASALVLAFFLELSCSAPGFGSLLYNNPFETVLNKASSVPNFGNTAQTGALDFSGIINHARQNVIYQYAGSLTTPPCSEGVTWLVVGKPLYIDLKAYLTGKKVLKFNSRFTQNAPGSQNLIQVAAQSLAKH